MKRELTQEEVESRQEQIREWELQKDVLEDEIEDARVQLANMNDALINRLVIVRRELKKLQNDYDKEITIRQLRQMLIKKNDNFKRIGLNIQALKKEIEEGVEMPEEKNAEKPSQD